MAISRIRWQLVIIVAAMAVAGAFSLFSTQEAESTGPFSLNGVAELDLTVDLPGTLPETHTVCRAVMSTDGSNVGTLNSVCYIVSKTGVGTPPAPPPPPPPFTDITAFPGGSVFTGAISQIDGSATMTTVGGICLPVDSALDVDTVPDTGLEVVLNVVAGKSGDLVSGTADLAFDYGTTTPAPNTDTDDAFDCDEIDDISTGNAITDTPLAANHDEDIWGDDPNTETAPDNCTTAQELGTVTAAGGNRDPFNWWDVFDPSLDGSVAGPDFFAVLGRFGTTDANGAAVINRNSDPTSAPPPTGYHPRFDRGGSIAGANPWNLNSPDGAVAGPDFFGVLGQFGLAC
jgi:hypothetical protein